MRIGRLVAHRHSPMGEHFDGTALGSLQGVNTPVSIRAAEKPPGPEMLNAERTLAACGGCTQRGRPPRLARVKDRLSGFRLSRVALKTS